MSIRVVKELNEKFCSLCKDLGLTPTVFTLFMKAVIRERKIPFEISEEEVKQGVFYKGKITMPLFLFGIHLYCILNFMMVGIFIIYQSYHIFQSHGLTHIIGFSHLFPSMKIKIKYQHRHF
ncbi:MAG: type II toxin-antitoxin system RelB/DinJ family antitoxin [Muribaculaceae bacterium]|nr:type II toxin-antitoxin system RelB/DinJ family antitoxin [Muribaculaceae bacterium]